MTDETLKDKLRELETEGWGKLLVPFPLNNRVKLYFPVPYKPPLEKGWWQNIGNGALPRYLEVGWANASWFISYYYIQGELRGYSNVEDKSILITEAEKLIKIYGCLKEFPPEKIILKKEEIGNYPISNLELSIIMGDYPPWLYAKCPINTPIKKFKEKIKTVLKIYRDLDEIFLK